MTNNTKIGLIVLTVILLPSCVPASVLVETNYEIDQSITASLGSEMIVIEKVRQTSTGNQILQAMADQAVVEKINFVATLTYTGKSGSSIKIAYREFSGVNNWTNARPAFYLDLELDLEDSEIIAIKNIQIEVIEATSSQIQFKVLNDGGLEWLPAID